MAIARALVKAPTVLLADEPTGNLDEGTRDEIMALLAELWRERGLTLVIVTHDTSVARLARTTGLMRDGRLEIRSGASPGQPAPDGANGQAPDGVRRRAPVVPDVRRPARHSQG